MIAEGAEYARRELDEEDIFADSWVTFRDRLRLHARVEDTETSTELMHAIHQTVLIQSFMSDVFYTELQEKTKTALLEGGESQKVEERDEIDEIEEEDGTPPEVNILAKSLNAVNTSNFFDTNYGTVQRSQVVEFVVNSLGGNMESPGEVAQHLSNVLVSILQFEFDELDGSYRNDIEEIYEELEKIQDGDIQTAQKTLEKYNIMWHTKMHGWPGVEEK